MYVNFKNVRICSKSDRKTGYHANVTGFSHLSPLKQNRSQNQKCTGDGAENKKVNSRPELGHTKEGPSEAVNAISQGVEIGKNLYEDGEIVQGKEGPGQEEDGHDHKVEDELETVRILHPGCQGDSQAGKGKPYQTHKNQGEYEPQRRGNSHPQEKRDREEDYGLDRSSGRSSGGPSQHDGKAGDGSHQHNLQKTELPVPDDRYSGNS